MAYSLDLRLKVLSSYEKSQYSQADIANMFGIAKCTLSRWIQKKKNGEDLSPPTTRSGRPRKIDKKGIRTIEKLVEKNPSITLSELSKLYYKKHKVTVSVSILFRELERLNLRYKKLSLHLIDKDRDEVKKKRILLARNKRHPSKKPDISR